MDVFFKILKKWKWTVDEFLNILKKWKWKVDIFLKKSANSVEVESRKVEKWIRSNGSGNPCMRGVVFFCFWLYWGGMLDCVSRTGRIGENFRRVDGFEGR